jgi:hypothetical protein
LQVCVTEISIDQATGVRTKRTLLPLPWWMWECFWGLVAFGAGVQRSGESPVGWGAGAAFRSCDRQFGKEGNSRSRGFSWDFFYFEI